MNRELAFFVPGTPQTAGSKSAFVNRATGRAIVTESGSKVSKERKKTWRSDLREHAQQAIHPDLIGTDWPGAPEHALYVRFVFVRKRPSNHLGTGKNAGVVKDWAVALRPTTRPDALKLARAAEDALTGVLWSDDSQIVAERLDKAYGDQVLGDPRAEGLLVFVRESGPYNGPTLEPHPGVPTGRAV